MYCLCAVYVLLVNNTADGSLVTSSLSDPFVLLFLLQRYLQRVQLRYIGPRRVLPAWRRLHGSYLVTGGSQAQGQVGVESVNICQVRCLPLNGDTQMGSLRSSLKTYTFHTPTFHTCVYLRYRVVAPDLRGHGLTRSTDDLDFSKEVWEGGRGEGKEVCEEREGGVMKEFGDGALQA